MTNIIGKPAVRPCESMSGCEKSAVYCSSMTRYHFEGEIDSEENPNRPIPLCDEHWEAYHDYWSEMWAEYNNSRY